LIGAGAMVGFNLSLLLNFQSYILDSQFLFFGTLLIPYVIICKSCSAKLKVSVPDLIGQTIDCPKCKTELTLTPPAGYQNRSLDSGDSTVTTTNSFDDLDDLLGAVQDSSSGHSEPAADESTKIQVRSPRQRSVDKLAAQSAKPVVELANHLESPKPKQTLQASAGENDPHDCAALDSPLLPDGSWDSDALKKRKRMIQFSALGIFGVILAVIAVSWFTGASAPDATVASIDEPQKVQGKDDSSSAVTTTTTEADPANVDPMESADTTSVTDLGDGDAAPVRGAADFAAPVIADSGFEAPAAENAVAPLPSSPGGRAEASAATKNTQSPSPRAQTGDAKNAIGAAAKRADTFKKKTPMESPLVSGRKPLSEFARALENAGTVLSEIKDQALLKREPASACFL
jgi:hypothetical protein